MWEYNYTPAEDELYHYGVPGMKWGHRRARRLYNKASIAKKSAREWDQMAKQASAKGKTRKANRYKNTAQDRFNQAADYERRALKKTRYGRQQLKSQHAKESANEWKELANKARSKGKIEKANKYDSYAKRDTVDSKKYANKSKATIARMERRGERVSSINKTNIKKGANKVSSMLKKK